MGVSIHITVYDVADLLNKIEKFVEDNGGYREDALPVRQWWGRVAPEFGLIEGDKFITLYNEYYEDYNAADEFFRAIERYYFPQNTDEFYFYVSGYSVEGANASEVLEELFPEEFGYEGKFGDE